MGSLIAKNADDTRHLFVVNRRFPRRCVRGLAMNNQEVR